MSSSNHDVAPSRLTIDSLNEACERALVSLEAEKARIQRLLKTAFENPLKAEQGLKACLRGYGLDGTFKVLNDQGLLPRSHYFGFTRGGLFARGDRFRAKEALQELPEAIRERELASKKLGDLINVRRSMLEQIASRTPPSPEQDHDRDNGRGRSRLR